MGLIITIAIICFSVYKALTQSSAFVYWAWLIGGIYCAFYIPYILGLY